MVERRRQLLGSPVQTGRMEFRWFIPGRKDSILNGVKFSGQEVGFALKDRDTCDAEIRDSLVATDSRGKECAWDSAGPKGPIEPERRLATRLSSVRLEQSKLKETKHQCGLSRLPLRVTDRDPRALPLTSLIAEVALSTPLVDAPSSTARLAVFFIPRSVPSARGRELRLLRSCIPARIASRWRRRRIRRVRRPESRRRRARPSSRCDRLCA